MSESILGHDLVALGALATTWSTENPNDGQLGFSQRCFVNVLPFQSLHGRKCYVKIPDMDLELRLTILPLLK